MKKKFKHKVLCFNMRNCCLVMKCLMLLVLLQLRTEVHAQSVSLNIKVEDASLVDVLKMVESQCDYTCLYSYDEVKKVVHLKMDLKNATINQVLDTCLKGTDLSYKIVDKTIVIRSSQKTESKGQRLLVGKVMDVKKIPLPGVTVLIKGTTVGVVTDFNGMYKFSIPDQKEVTLVFSFVGMVAKDVKVTKEKEINVVLEEDVKDLGEVVVTGYGSVKSSSFTGNSVTVKRDDLLKVSKTNIIQAIQAFDPSFRIKENNQWGSDPNSIPEVYIRGESGISSTKELDRNPLSKSNLVDNPNLPTFIMDGFEIDVTKLYDFDPNRIESITILKDAAATALYGSRAANGVIIITTVVPKGGKLNVSYNLVGNLIAPDLSDYHLLNAEQKLEVERLCGYFIPVPGATKTQYLMDYEYYSKLNAVKRGVDTYWLSKPLRSVFNHQHSLYVDGGGDNFRFGIDLQYVNQDGVMKGSLRDRRGAGIYIQYVYKALSIRNNVSFQMIQSSNSPYGDFSEYTKQLPYNEYKDENGKYLKTLKWGSVLTGNINPLYESTLNNIDESKTEQWTNNLSINWNIMHKLLLRGQIGLTRNIESSERFLDPLSQRNSMPLTLVNLKTGELYLNNLKSFTYDMNFTLSYNGVIHGHMINALGAFNMKENIRESNSVSFRGFPSGELSSPEFAQEMVDKGSYVESRSRLVGFLATVNYSYKDIYLLDASIRVDGSSSFGADKRYAPFWTTGVGINLHKYKIFSDLGFINILKFRGSYGQTGKVNFPAYAARTTYEIFTDEWYKTGYGSALKALGNKNLTWETTNTLDIGGEVSLFNNFIYLKGSYYDRTTVDLVTDVTLPSSTGFHSYKDNIGEVANRGYEFEFRVNAIRSKDMSLFINGNLAHNKNKILKISESLKAYNERVVKKFENAAVRSNEAVTPLMQYQEGGSLNSIWGVRSLGVNPADGQEVFVKKDGSLTNTWIASEQITLGNKDPKAQGSFSINFTYKQFNLFTSFLYEFGGQRYNQTLVDKVENIDVYVNNVDERVLTSRWKKPGDKALYKAVGIGETRPTSRFVQDYNVLTWNSIELGYDLKSRFTSKLQMNMFRFSVGMNELMHLSSVKQERGLSYPFARTINFSLRASF